MRPRREVTMKKRARRILAVVLALIGLGLLFLLAAAWQGMGQRARGARLARMQRSAQWHGDRFENPEPIVNDVLGVVKGMLAVSPDASPVGRVPNSRSTRAACAPYPRVACASRGSATRPI